jgi:predicted  nucleic acid-binding Zn-ribbon protein
MRIAMAGEELRTALRDRFDEVQNAQNDLQSKCGVLEIEKQELNKKIEQRDQRIKELEATTSDLYGQMFDKTKNHSQEMDALRSLIQVRNTLFNHLSCFNFSNPLFILILLDTEARASTRD